MDDELGLPGLDAFLAEFKTWKDMGIGTEPWPSIRAVPPEDIIELMMTGLRERVAGGDLLFAFCRACGR